MTVLNYSQNVTFFPSKICSSLVPCKHFSVCPRLAITHTKRAAFLSPRVIGMGAAVIIGAEGMETDCGELLVLFGFDLMSSTSSCTLISVKEEKSHRKSPGSDARSCSAFKNFKNFSTTISSHKSFVHVQSISVLVF